MGVIIEKYGKEYDIDEVIDEISVISPNYEKNMQEVRNGLNYVEALGACLDWNSIAEVLFDQYYELVISEGGNDCGAPIDDNYQMSLKDFEEAQLQLIECKEKLKMNISDEEKQFVTDYYAKNYPL